MEPASCIFSVSTLKMEAADYCETAAPFYQGRRPIFAQLLGMPHLLRNPIIHCLAHSSPTVDTIVSSTPSSAPHHRQLHTTVSSKPSSAPHHRQLHTTVSSTPPSAPHHRQLHTTVSSTPPSAPHPPSLLLIINFNGNLYFTRAFVSDIPTISL